MLGIMAVTKMLLNQILHVYWAECSDEVKTGVLTTDKVDTLIAPVTCDPSIITSVPMFLL